MFCSRGFLPRFAAALAALTAACALVHAVPAARFAVEDAYEAAKVRLMGGAAALGWWSLISLLSSSCCALQLLLSCFSVGCAGFNTYLGPVRPVTVSGALLGQLWMWHNVRLPVQVPRAVAATAVTASLTLMPEALWLYARWRSSSSSSSSSFSFFSGTSDAAASSAVPPPRTARLEFNVEGMGCLACLTTIQNAIVAIEGVVDCKIELEAGTASVLVQNNDGAAADAASDAICEAVTAIGFPTSRATVTASAKDADAGDGGGDGGVAAAAVAATAAAKQTDAVASSAATSITTASRRCNVCLRVSTSPLCAVAAGLLSSSCCAVQLLLNLNMLAGFGVGCAGFNKVLGPLRPTLRALTLGWLGVVWIKGLRVGVAVNKKGVSSYSSSSSSSSSSSQSRRLRQLAVHTAITLSLMFLPEALRWSGGPALAPPTQGAITMRFAVPGLGCEACEVATRTVIDRQPGGAGSSVNFVPGRAEIVVAPGYDFREDTLRRALEDAGYGLADPSTAAPPTKRQALGRKEPAAKEELTEEETRLAEGEGDDGWLD